MYARPGSWLFGWLVELCPGSLWLAGRLRPRDGQREAQRGPERRSGDRTNLPCVWLEAPTIRFTTREAPHRFLCVTPEENPADYYELGFQTEIHFKPRASPQAELRPGRLPTSRITTREAELRPGTLCIFCMLPTEDDDVMELPVKLPVRASSQRSPETRREPQRGTETHREASASAQTVSDQKVFRCLSKYYVTRRRLSSSLSSQVSICKVICNVLYSIVLYCILL